MCSPCSCPRLHHMVMFFMPALANHSSSMLKQRPKTAGNYDHYESKNILDEEQMKNFMYWFIFMFRLKNRRLPNKWASEHQQGVSNWWPRNSWSHHHLDTTEPSCICVCPFLLYGRDRWIVSGFLFLLFHLNSQIFTDSLLLCAWE